MEIVFFILSAFVYLDCLVLKHRSLELFLRVFSLTPQWQVIYSVIFLGGLAAGLFPHLDTNILFSFFTIFVFSLYMGGRVRFKNALFENPVLDSGASSKLILASESLEVFLLWFVWMLIGSVIFKILARVFPALGTPMSETAIFSMYSSCVMFFYVYRMVKVNKKFSFREVTGLRSNGKSFFVLVILPIILGSGMALGTFFLQMIRPEVAPTPFGQMVQSINSVGIFLTFLSAAVVLAPFFEEVIFRGFFFYVISFLGGRVMAILLVVSLFALMHVEQYWGDGMTIALVAFLGIILTGLRAWTGSSIPGIVTHYVFNGTMVILPLVFVLLSNPIYFEYQTRYFQLDAPAKEAMLVRSIKAYPHHSVSYNDLAWLYAEEGKNLDQALILIDKALSYEPQNYAFLDTKAEVLFKMGKSAQAIALEQELITRYPGNPLLEKQLQKFKARLKE